MASDSGDSSACGDDLCKSLSYDAIYRFVETGTAIELDEHRRVNKALLVHFKGYDDPETARLLTGIELMIANEELPQLQRGEFYWHQLQDLRVVNQHEQMFGRVSHLLETGANDVLVVKADSESIDDRERLIPYLVDSVVTEIDLENQTIRVDWEAEYLD